MSSTPSKSSARRAKEKEAIAFVVLNYAALLYVMKRLHNLVIKATKPGGDMHLDMDWGYDGLRKRMCVVGKLDVTKTSNANTASQVRNKMGRSGSSPTELKHYGAASRKSNADGKCTFSPLVTFIVYPGSKDLCDVPWGAIVKALDQCGFTKQKYEKLGISKALINGTHLQRKERKTMVLQDMVDLCKEHQVLLDTPLSLTDSAGGKGKAFYKSKAMKGEHKRRVKDECKTECKTEIKDEIKDEIKGKIKAEGDNVKRRGKKNKVDSFGDRGRSGDFMGNPNRERQKLELEYNTHLPSWKKSAEPTKTHKLGELPGRRDEVEVVSRSLAEVAAAAAAIQAATMDISESPVKASGTR